jgi:hypothetical protein
VQLSDGGVQGNLQDDHGTGRHDSAVADGNAWHDGGVPADPYVVSDDRVAAAVFFSWL